MKAVVEITRAAERMNKLESTLIFLVWQTEVRAGLEDGVVDELKTGFSHINQRTQATFTRSLQRNTRTNGRKEGRARTQTSSHSL